VQTVNGAAQNIFGKISIPVHYKGICAEITLFLCLFLEQEIYLRVDFWREFGKAPQILSLEEITPEKDAQSKNKNLGTYGFPMTWYHKLYTELITHQMLPIAAWESL